MTFVFVITIFSAVTD